MSLAGPRNKKSTLNTSKAFLHSENETSQAEFRKKVPSDMATGKIKYTGIKLTKVLIDLDSENSDTGERN